MATNKKIPYQLSKRVGLHDDAPLPDATSWSHPDLKGAVDVDFILINDVPESLDRGDYTFDTSTGTIDRTPNPFGDITIVVPYNKIAAK